jgi:hypothetical protein
MILFINAIVGKYEFLLQQNIQLSYRLYLNFAHDGTILFGMLT